jgi:hypothetical protein
MSKLCNTIDEAERTVASYQEKYKIGESPYDSPYYVFVPSLRKWVIKNRSTGKVLKNINYTPVKW